MRAFLKFEGVERNDWVGGTLSGRYGKRVKNAARVPAKRCF
jgi:hypothetical protein